jgi:hypothetical protein
VTPMTEDCGLVEWVPRTMGIRHAIHAMYVAEGMHFRTVHARINKTYETWPKVGGRGFCRPRKRVHSTCRFNASLPKAPRTPAHLVLPPMRPSVRGAPPPPFSRKGASRSCWRRC